MELEEVYAYLNEICYVSLATVEVDQPRVRTMAFVKYDRKYWVVTFSGTAKLAQIKKNGKIEISCDIYDKESAGSIRGLGLAIICSNPDVKRAIIPSIEFFSRFFKSPDDPNYTLIQLQLTQLEVQSPTNKKMYLFKI